MKIKHVLFSYLIVFLCFSVGLQSVIAAPINRTVKGTVRDSKNNTIPGANIFIKGTTNGVASDFDGNYSISVNNDEAILVFSSVGFVSQEIAVGNQTVINLSLKEESTSLDEVIVVGYGTQRKSDIVGSISVATAAQLLESPNFNALQGLKGKVAGVTVFSNTGNPMGVSESGQRVLIRGMNSIKSNNDPLYVVDGVQMNEIQFINPNDIERMEVLKDASATAIYGARGANGVILVTTKRGNVGEGKTVVSYSGWMSVATMAKKVDLLNASEFMEVLDRGFANIDKYQQGRDNLEKLGVTELLVDRSDPLIFDENGNPRYDTDWQDEATRNAFSHSHQLNIQNQGTKSSVGAFINYTDQQGILLNNFSKRISGKMTYDAKPTNWMDISTNMMVNHMWGNSVDDTGGNQTARRTMWEMIPILPVRFPDGSWSNPQFVGNKFNYRLEGMSNPVHELTTAQRMRYRTKIFGNLGFTFHLADGLDLKTQLGTDANIRMNKTYLPSDLTDISLKDIGRAETYNGQNYYWQEETFLSYNKVLNDIHRINGTLGMSWSGFVETAAHPGNVKNFPSDANGFNNLEAGTIHDKSKSSYKKWTMNSYFGRISYTLKDKYLLTATMRVDGSSRFGKNNKYGYFPSAGLGWIMTNEGFMSGTKSWLSNLKLHTSYGMTGNTEIDPYSTLSTVGFGTTLMDGKWVSNAELKRMPNPDLKWETTTQFDAGINLGLFGNRINIDFDYYYKITDDLLMDRSLPFTTGFNSVVENIGRVDNSGIDLLISSTNIDTENFTWETTFNLNYNTNKIKRLGAKNEDQFVGENQILRVGEAMGSFYLFERLGTWGTDEVAAAAAKNAVPGEKKFSETQKVYASGLPKITGSFINKFIYKNFDFTLDFQFVTGVNGVNRFYHSMEDRTGIANSLKSVLYDSWTPTNQNTMVQQIRHSGWAGQSASPDSHWLVNASYIRANLIQLGYTLDSKIVEKLKINTLRFNVGISNAFVIHHKDFKGYDPEGTSSTDRFGQNMFFFQYPSARTFTAGLNFSF